MVLFFSEKMQLKSWSHHRTWFNSTQQASGAVVTELPRWVELGHRGWAMLSL